MDVYEICKEFDLGAPTSPLSYVARGELGRVSRLATTAGVWALKEIDLFLPTLEVADANVDLQESMLDAGVNMPRLRRTVDGHGLFRNVRVYEWRDMSPVPVGDVGVEELVAASVARMHQHAPPTDRTPDPWYTEATSRDEWKEIIEEGADTWWAPVVAGLVNELTAGARPDHSPARICHLDVCPENVFLSNGRLTVIDWENAGPAATVQDLGSTLWDFCQGDVGRTRAFVHHYAATPVRSSSWTSRCSIRRASSTPISSPSTVDGRSIRIAQRRLASGPNARCEASSPDRSPGSSSTTWLPYGRDSPPEDCQSRTTASPSASTRCRRITSPSGDQHTRVRDAERH
jgi:hypothetical protein